MLEYEWGNPSTIMLSGGDDQQAGSNHEVQDQNRQASIFDHYTTQSFNDNNLIPQHNSPTIMFQNHPTTTNATHHNINSFFDPRAYAGAGPSSFPTTHHPSLLSLDPIPTVTSVATATSYFLIPKKFDNGKRSCRKRLADHNRRRRKSHQINQENQKSHLENAAISSSEILTRSPPDSVAHPTSSVTVAMSPPRMSLDCFKQRSYQATASSSTSSSSLFFSSG
ncbi:squamosa promoter-binding-like protein 8 [Populus alba x Populus x berolinensis]|uniref:Squamosa promoter-binding-like protein 8 n=1 Tax=Populus alba x Populus x berolinensis TaxID=444605 RepID=A0AAD6PY94_9ROSI|nr:squamosa promoter-binding-like protein 8 [Populus alba x Populus x berolinensis]